MKVEICCGSLEDAMIAYNAGIKRIELNSALFLGGLSPSFSAIKILKEKTDLEIIAMARIRGGGFFYNDIEYEQLKKEIEDMLKLGVDGICCGILTEDKNIDTKRISELVRIVHEYKKTFVFHRAIDLTDDIFESTEILIDLGVDRILTSGGKKTAILGKGNIKELVKRYSKDIEILAGSGINYENATDFIDYTKVDQIHSSCSTMAYDETSSNEFLSFDYDRKNQFEITSAQSVEKLLKVADSYEI
ncbi:MAG: copper homeostasis protein CutC [Tissierellia bacterium]|nr:copper homeostasis protein CutC [Tissierellia bacterium]